MAKHALTIVGEKGRTFKIDLKNPLQRRYGMVRELSLSSEQRALICAKFSYTRKTGNEYLRAWNELGGEGLMDKPGGSENQKQTRGTSESVT